MARYLMEQIQIKLVVHKSERTHHGQLLKALPAIYLVRVNRSHSAFSLLDPRYFLMQNEHLL